MENKITNLIKSALKLTELIEDVYVRDGIIDNITLPDGIAFQYNHLEANPTEDEYGRINQESTDDDLYVIDLIYDLVKNADELNEEYIKATGDNFLETLDIDKLYREV